MTKHFHMRKRNCGFLVHDNV